MRGCWPAVMLSLLAACGTHRGPAPITERGADRKTAAARTPQPAAEGYRVRSGDTLYGIALAHDPDYRELARRNALAEPYLIRPGQWLALPREKSVTPVAVTPGVATAPLPSVGGVIAARPLGGIDTGRQAADTLMAGIDWQWPVAGKVLTEFDPGAGRKGLDIIGARGGPVHAAASGTVVYAGSALRGYGKLTIISHGPAHLSAYAHQQTQNVVEGQAVAAGQIIGAMGDSDTDRVKLHFEVREYGRPVDPRRYLPTRSEHGPG